ncbi:flagellar hook assembly protein FlgD [Gallaecimonas mangrovi]|uniref:flagellar hook assembly protein FlgD n=1 Tax=Gallaecimonas mangrovi TaxID=2291597 RepID=UPI000E1FF16B|nr:flagellar hook assembly protein FlgD [Gallaecimonas mangrovi]
MSNVISNNSLDPLANSRWDAEDPKNKAKANATTAATDTSAAAAAAGKKGLSQEDFLSLLTKQLAYQDPFKPVDNDQMISQMASFATVDGIHNMNDQFGSLNKVMTSNQALQASTLVGQKVLIPTATGHLNQGGTMTGMVTSKDAAKNVVVRIEDKSGQLIKTINMGDLSSGNNKIEWDGTTNSGQAAPEGSYTIKASGMVDDKRTDLNVASYANVESVTLGSASSGGVLLNLKGLGGVKLSDVLEVAKS